MPIAIASDAAFHFRYPEAGELLADEGVEVQPWSPLADEPLPPGCRGLILPGGYPELHAGQLATSQRSLAAIRGAAAAGPEEIGGLKVLARVMEGVGGKDLRPIAEEFKKQLPDGVIALIGTADGKAAATVAEVAPPAGAG